jgi:carbamoyltransferase
MAENNVIGWVQGRSEFGPRALGNRSILADPRPAQNKDIINAMVKKREAFRPFAPAVLEEEAAAFFELPKGVERLPFMTFVVKVRQEKQAALGAITHCDGTARIQTVSKRTNEKFWSLIAAFNRITGLPVLLNTSFNNNAEPIVDSVEDAVVCFLTTKLHYLVVGDYLVRKREISPSHYLELFLSIPLHLTLHQSRGVASKDGTRRNSFEIRCLFENRLNTTISAEMFDLLMKADGTKRLAELLPQHTNDAEGERLLGEIIELWLQRSIVLRPQAASVHS